jgi:hypothetical protein
MLRKEINSGATRIFRPMGKLLLCRKKSMGKWAVFLLMGKKLLVQQNIRNVEKKQENEISFF